MERSARRLVTTLGATSACGLLGVAVLGGLALGTTTPTAAQQQQQTGRTSPGTELASSTSPSAASGATITVTAVGQASGTPDTVSVQMGITASGSTASGTLDQANSEMSTLQGVFLKVVKASQLQTSGLDLNPTYDSSNAIDGYSADEELTVTMHDMALAGQLIDAASHAVGNDAHLDGISFSISNTSSLMSSARAQAMQNAYLEASEIASGAGVSLGPIKSVTDQEQPQQPNFPDYAMSPGLASGAAVPIEAGKQSLSVQVQVVYQLGK